MEPQLFGSSQIFDSHNLWLVFYILNTILEHQSEHSLHGFSLVRGLLDSCSMTAGSCSDIS